MNVLVISVTNSMMLEMLALTSMNAKSLPVHAVMQMLSVILDGTLRLFFS